MPRLSKRLWEEWAFFLHPKTGGRTYNPICRSCVNNCKQSFRVEVLECLRYLSKCSVYYAQKSKRKREK